MENSDRKKPDEAKDTVCLFDFDEEKCDAMIIAKDKKLKMPSSFLCYVSEAFKGELEKNSNVITDKTFDSDIVIVSLSNYRPQFCKTGTSENEMFFLISHDKVQKRSLLVMEFARKWKLSSIITTFSDNLLDTANNVFHAEIKTTLALNVLSLCEEHDLSSVLEFCLSKKPYLGTCFLSNASLMEMFMKLQRRLRYEIIKNTYMQVIMKGKVESLTTKSLQDIEINIILNYLDGLVYGENLNAAIPRKRKFPWQVSPCKFSNDFFLENGDTDLTIIIDEHKLYVNRDHPGRYYNNHHDRNR